MMTRRKASWASVESVTCEHENRGVKKDSHLSQQLLGLKDLFVEWIKQSQHGINCSGIKT